KALTIKNQKGYSFLDFDDIFLIRSSSNYTYFYTTTLQSILVSKTMKEFEPYLSDQFLRTHKGFIINTKYIRFLNTTRKKLQLAIPQLLSLKSTDDFLLPINDLLVEDNNLEIPIGEAFLDKVKNSVLYN